ncbi:hypothetical protein DMB65_04575 [Flavobacterium cheongpyeongense]|uniref:Potassium channel domain-containing protein n=1 Tax=Flavobacterium cheongpyeongense TaxID=2212651 RepID=A0A2V4C6M8_9FLAO|nr:potassium channel family protein [Flavobacterium cheongpyeongense]PXY41844.1 hypothetical protein DMB65_04575 [Flavobacterium cheongpyeongense]
MKPEIIQEDILQRVIFPSQNNHSDYIDNDIRRIFEADGKHEYENKIFNETVALCLPDTKVKIIIRNCDFKKGLVVRRTDAGSDKEYSIHIYKTNIPNKLVLPSWDACNKIDIDTCKVDKLYVTGKNKKISFYSSTLSEFHAEYGRCKLFKVENSAIEKFSLFKFESSKVEFDTDDLAIRDKKRFITRTAQTFDEVSEIYHKLVLKSAKSIKAKRQINYQLSKATSNWTSLIFGYFFKPLYVIYWMIGVVIVYAGLYHLLLHINFVQALYFSAYTFLTIGFSDVGQLSDASIAKAILIFTEGLFGITYCAAFLTSIINSSKK